MSVKFRQQALDHAARRLDGDVILFAPPTVRFSVMVAMALFCTVGFAVANIKVPDTLAVVATMVGNKGVDPVIAQQSGTLSALHLILGQHAEPGTALASIDLGSDGGRSTKQTFVLLGSHAGLVCCQSVNKGMRVDPGDLLFGLVRDNTDISILFEVPSSLAESILACRTIMIRSDISPVLRRGIAGSVLRVPSGSAGRQPGNRITLQMDFDAADQPTLRNLFAAGKGNDVPVFLELPARTLLEKLTEVLAGRSSQGTAGKGV